MSTLILTGGAGFIGSNLARAILARDVDRLVVLDKLTYAGHRESLAEIADDPRFELVEGDIADAEGVDALFARCRPSAILNLAAESHVDRSIDAPEAFLRTNVLGTFQLLEASRRHLRSLPAGERDGFRFLHVSTDEVYGSLGDEGCFSETTAYDPSSPYAASKAAADHLVQAWGRTYGVPVLITNCSNNYGPFQLPEKLIPLMILNAVNGRKLPIYGDGLNVRDWIHVEDHCRGILDALDRGRPGRSYNLGARCERTNLQIVEAICDGLEELLPAADNDALRHAGAKRYRELMCFVEDRPGHDRRYAVDGARAREEIGFEPRIEIERGLRSTVRWYLDHAAWCAAVGGAAIAGERLGRPVGSPSGGPSGSPFGNP